MIRIRTTTALLAAALIVACGSDGGTGPTPSYESIAGSYAGNLGGIADGIALSSQFSLTINQSSGTLSGTYAITGSMTDGINVDQFIGTGTIQGTMASGSNPSVNITVLSASCPNQPMPFSGTFDSANQRLTIIGPIKFFNGDCSVWWQVQANIVLTK